MISIWAPWALRLLALAAVLVLLLRAYRSIAARCGWAGWLVAAGVAGRAVLAFALFFVSYLDLPLLESLHTGDGFWELAPDARLYFNSAVGILQSGPSALTTEGPAPTFVAALTAWMWLVGISPAAGALLNICCYVLVCWLLVRILEDRPAAALAGVAAFTLSPALVVFGSQSLKDGFFAAAVACTCAGAWRLLVVPGVARRPVRPALLAPAVILGGLYVAAGMRTYYAVFLWGALSAVLLGAAVTRGRRGMAWRLLAAAAFCALGYTVIAVGAGARYDRFVAQVAGRPSAGGGEESDAGSGSATVEAFDRARSGFISSGGGTNLSESVDSAGSAESRGLADRLRAVALGLLVVFVPVKLLGWLGLLHFSGGRGLIALADIDTLFVDLSLLIVLAMVWRGWRRRQLSLPYALFIALLTVPTLLALAYVVTNFGTLFRLRLIVAVPLWMLTLSLARPAKGAAAIDAVRRAPNGAAAGAAQPEGRR